ncbi:hypothetical protein INS90_10185 [Trueperella pecoris]|uniref:Uncharacterized protein n=1 Tax=Trueperella pecoris TaxID=2733571 RepID=A0A7M1R2A9_9ACTO|nr:hypothetical protein [Trueperella pecoris]QOR47597.1 hypothetical protein INS90_10185 [Trueperella pecoris]
MTTYEMPKDPKRDVWDRHGRKWAYDTLIKAYLHEGSSSRLYYPWWELLGAFSPITDVKTPVVGEEFIVSSTTEGTTIECPDYAAYIDQEGGVLQAIRGRFYNPGYPSAFDGFWPGTWRRIA